MKGEKEIRTSGRIEKRAEGDPPENPIIAGHAAIFDDWADLYSFEEMIAPGAFANAVKTDDVRALFNHNPDLILGRNGSGTLNLAEDSIGLSVEIFPDLGTEIGNRVYRAIERGDISQMSFGFEVLDEEWKFEKGQKDKRIIREVKLYDVSPVTFPAYVNTDVAVRTATLKRSELEKLTQPIPWKRKLFNLKLRRFEK